MAKRFKARIASKRGMTLVEVLVAMSVLMVIIFTFMPLYAQYFKNIKNAGQMTRRTYEKASLIERLLSNRENFSSIDSHYKTENVVVPLELNVEDKNHTIQKTLKFHSGGGDTPVATVSGNLFTTDGDKTGSGNDYTTLYLASSSQRLVCFPSALTDDFIEKDIIVVPIGFSETTIDTSAFTVYYSKDGDWESNVLPPEYYTINKETDNDGKTEVAKFTFKGANEKVCFDNSPLVITYKSKIYRVEVEIIAPKIIMVGEKARDGKYYYYATSGVDPMTGKMDLIAKESAHLKSAMNDVEWVDKGMGDNGNGAVNEHGYYIMGGDAGQVRRFWKNPTTGNYYWGGDYLYNYTSVAHYTGSSGASTDSYEEFSRSTEKLEQASFKKIVSTDTQRNFTGNVNVNMVLDYYKAGVDLGFNDIGGRRWQGMSTNYFTANVTSADKGKFQLTLGRFLNYNAAAGWCQPRSGMDIGFLSGYFANTDIPYANAGFGNKTEMVNKSDVGATANENDKLVTHITYDDKHGKHLDVEGYKTATDYEYSGNGQVNDVGADGVFNDTSLITITSVGAIQIGSAANDNWKSVQGSSPLTGDVYPTESYTLYCGYIPAVIDMYGRQTDENYGTDNPLLLNREKWLHLGTYGAVTDGTDWYPVGKFGDIYSESTDLDMDVFENAKVTENGKTYLKWKKLLNFYNAWDDRNAMISDFQSPLITGEVRGTIYQLKKDPVETYVGKYTHYLKFKVEVQKKNGCNTEWVPLEPTNGKDGWVEWYHTILGVEYTKDKDWSFQDNSYPNHGADQNIIAQIKEWTGVTVEAKKYRIVSNINAEGKETAIISKASSDSTDINEGTWIDSATGLITSNKSPDGDEYSYYQKFNEARYRGIKYVAGEYEEVPNQLLHSASEGKKDGITFFGPSPGKADEYYEMFAADSARPTEIARFKDNVGTALPGYNNRSRLTSAQEVDITIGYLSHPYAIGVESPAVPQFGKSSGGTGRGSDAIFTNNRDLGATEPIWDHTFFAGGFRDNVTMLDIKSHKDDLSDSTFTIAVGYTLSYLFDDFRSGSGGQFLCNLYPDYTYARTASCDQIMNTGVVYLRATGDGSASDADPAGSMESGAGYTLKQATNVFHQFYGMDRYSNQGGLSYYITGIDKAAFGWDTDYHRAYFNIARDQTKEISDGYCVNKTEGNTKFGTNCHPMAQTECTCVNWGQTWDEKTQAMWGTKNGTLLSWYYDYENEDKTDTHYVYKEFESYIWAERRGKLEKTTPGIINLTGGNSTLKGGNQDYGMVKVTKSGNTITETKGTSGFISMLKSVNCVAYGDGYWVAVGDCSGRDPATALYYQNKEGNVNYPATGVGTYINVKADDGTGTFKWIGIKVSDKTINFESVEYCEGIWYAMGYIDANGNGKIDLDNNNEYAVVYYATNPSVMVTNDMNEAGNDGYTSDVYNGGWRQALSRTKDGKYTSRTNYKDVCQTEVLKTIDNGQFEDFVLEGANSMASQG